MRVHEGGSCSLVLESWSGSLFLEDWSLVFFFRRGATPRASLITAATQRQRPEARRPGQSRRHVLRASRHCHWHRPSGSDSSR